MATPVHITLVTRSSFINEWRNKYYHNVMGNNKLQPSEQVGKAIIMKSLYKLTVYLSVIDTINSFLTVQGG
jgi:hypothetical protein